jgi:hypothetical protein
MQAQPQSNLAARIPSASPRTLAAASSTQPPPESRTPPSLANTLGLAHDAGNLLAALGLYCDLLSVPGVLRPEHQHYATELCLISDRSSNLIQRLLAAPIATIPDAAQPNGAAPLSLPPAILRRPDRRSSDAITTTPNPAMPNHADMLRSLAPVLQRIAAGAATVTVNCPASLPPLDFPAEIIERITVNLVRNAAEAIRIQRATARPPALRPPGEIQVTLAVVASRVQFTVEDNGPGMPPTIAAAYLQPTPLPHGASRGLGHRIVHELATSSAGQLSIRVRPGHGTVFCLKWPIPSSAFDQRGSLDTPSVPSLMTA